jgi:hypothetical protein
MKELGENRILSQAGHLAALEPSSMRFTVRRMMMFSAALAVVLGLGIEAHRLILRYRYCQEMARRHSAWSAMTQKSADKETERIGKLDRVVSRLAGLSPQTLDELVAASGDPVFTAWFLKGQRRELLTDGADEQISPRELVSHIEHFWGRGWRETVNSVHRSRAKHIRLEQEYRFASLRPWVNVPPDTPPEPLD